MIIWIAAIFFIAIAFVQWRTISKIGFKELWEARCTMVIFDYGVIVISGLYGFIILYGLIKGFSTGVQ